VTKKSVSYDPGKPTAVRQIGPNLYAIDSFRGESKSYTVSLGGQPTCSCPHFRERLAGTPGAECKHITDTRRQARFLKLLDTARALCDSDLARLLVRYTELGDPEMAGALRVAREERRMAAARAAHVSSIIDRDTALKALFA
jgi:hypothetical protein